MSHLQSWISHRRWVPQHLFLHNSMLFWSISHRRAFFEQLIAHASATLTVTSLVILHKINLKPNTCQVSKKIIMKTNIFSDPLRVTIFNVCNPYKKDQPLVSLLHFKYALPASGSSPVVFSLAPPFDSRQISAGSYRTILHQLFFWLKNEHFSLFQLWENVSTYLLSIYRWLQT